MVVVVVVTVVVTVMMMAIMVVVMMVKMSPLAESSCVQGTVLITLHSLPLLIQAGRGQHHLQNASGEAWSSPPT